MKYNTKTFWRFKKDGDGWRVGFPRPVEHQGMVRMSSHGGFDGPVVKISEIEYIQSKSMEE